VVSNKPAPLQRASVLSPDVDYRSVSGQLRWLPQPTPDMRLTRLSLCAFTVAAMAIGTNAKPRDTVADTRVLNQAIRQSIAKCVESAPREDDDDFEWSFVCECGCLTWVKRTTASFDQEGAWMDGHNAAP
jgi:hypothetical protein